MKLVIATDNKNKVKEIKEVLKDFDFEILSKKELGLGDLNIVENAETLEGNAKIKAEAISKKIDSYILADDTGLFVKALNGEPGVRSARYAGDHDEKENRKKLLKNLEDKDDRSAYFKTVLCLISPDKNLNFIEGTCKGIIANEEKGKGGFGYDPIFIPEGQNKTFGQMSLLEKNIISHRGRALENLKKYFTELI